MKELLDEIVIWINHNRRKFIGGLLGFIISVFILTVGFFKTLFIMICTIGGYVLGNNIDKEDIKKFIEKIFSNR